MRARDGGSVVRALVAHKRDGGSVIRALAAHERDGGSVVGALAAHVSLSLIPSDSILSLLLHLTPPNACCAARCSHCMRHAHFHYLVRDVLYLDWEQ